MNGHGREVIEGEATGSPGSQSLGIKVFHGGI